MITTHFGDELGFAVETLAQALVVQLVRVHHLQRAPSLDVQLEDFIDRAHAPGLKRLDDLVLIGEPIARRQV